MGSIHPVFSRDMRSAKSGPNLCQIWQVFGPWASPYGANGQMTMTVHNYRPRQFHRTSNGSKTHSPNVPTRAGTCRHMCRHLQVPTRADIRHTNHMDFFICKLGCAGMCQHLKKCRHLGRCRHVPTSVILIIWTFLFANWDVLACVSTWKSADTWEGADTCRHPSY